jgi:hypothetical protein
MRRNDDVFENDHLLARDRDERDGVRDGDRRRAWWDLELDDDELAAVLARRGVGRGIEPA